MSDLCLAAIAAATVKMRKLRGLDLDLNLAGCVTTASQRLLPLLPAASQLHLAPAGSHGTWGWRPELCASPRCCGGPKEQPQALQQAAGSPLEACHVRIGIINIQWSKVCELRPMQECGFNLEAMRLTQCNRDGFVTHRQSVTARGARTACPPRPRCSQRLRESRAPEGNRRWPGCC